MVESYRQPTIKDLKEIKLLSPMTENELQTLISSGKIEHFEAHSNIIVEGEPSWGLFLILGGLVSVLKTNKVNQDTFEVAQLRVGGFFGEMSLVDDHPRSATVKALSDCSLFHIPKAALESLLERSIDLRIRFFQNCIKDIVHRLRELDDNYVISQYQLWQVALKQEAAS